MERKQTLKEYLKVFPNIVLGEPEDNEDILSFLRGVPMESGEISLRYKRAPDYFKFLKEQSDHFYIFKMLNKDLSLGGIGVFSIRDAWIDGKKARVGYTCDLRVSPTLWSRARVQWRKTYSSLMKDYQLIDEFDGVEYFYTAVLDDNEAAIRALTQSSKGFVYRPICKYQSLNIYGRTPLLNRFTNTNVGVTTGANKEELLSFLEAQNRSIPGGYYYDHGDSHDEAVRREQYIEGYDFSKYLVVKNNEGRIIACCNPWSTSKSRQIIVDNMDVKTKLLGALMPLASGKRLCAGDPLNMLYLCDLTYEQSLDEKGREDCLLGFLHYVYDQGLQKNYHLITILDFYQPGIKKALTKSHYLFESKGGTLFQVCSDEASEDTYMDPVKQIGFELAFS
jgi:hypothetical protein